MNFDFSKLDRSQRHKQFSVLPFINSWEVNQSIWMKERQADWEILHKYEFNETPKAELETYKKYFLYGELIDYIPARTKWLLTPIMHSQKIYAFFYSSSFSSEDKKQLLYILPPVTHPEAIRALPWIRQKSLNFIGAVLGKDYQLLKMPVGMGDFKVFSPPPTYWSNKFIISSTWLFKRGGYFPIMDALDYFISCLKQADDPKYRSSKYFNEMWTLMEQVLKDDTADEYAKEHAENLKAREQEIRDAWAVYAHLDK